MARLPQPGSDDGTWGSLLNDFLAQSLNADGSLKNITQSSVTGLTASLSAKASQTDLTALQTTVSASYNKPANGIPRVDLTTDIQTTLNRADARNAASLQGTPVSQTAPANGQVLQYSGAAWAPATVTASGTVADASTTAKGLVRLSGDLSGTADAPTVPGALKAGNNLADLANTTTAKANLNLATVATTGSYADLTNKPVQTAAPNATTSAAGVVRLNGDLSGTADAPTVPGALKSAANLSDIANPATARTNLGLGSASTQASAAFAPAVTQTNCGYTYRLVYNTSGNTYPTRPAASAVAAGLAEYVGPVQPTDWLLNDTWRSTT